MSQAPRLFRFQQPFRRRFSAADLLVFVGIGILTYIGVRLALNAPTIIRGPEISLSPRALPYYAGLSLGRMASAYLLSVIFTFTYGRIAAYNHRAERILIPLLDVLQSVPILSFLPLVLLSLSAFLPVGIAAELASVVLIFTGQAWNLTFSWYQSLTTIPKELREASTIFRFNSWYRFKTLELPFGAISFIWNSMMSWAGGWFFLMAAEIFTVGQRDFRLPGLGAYLQTAANQGNLRAIFWGIGTLILLIFILDQFFWRPLLAWSAKFKLEMIEGSATSTSWFYDLLTSSDLVAWFHVHLLDPITQRLDHFLARLFPGMNDTILLGENRQSINLFNMAVAVLLIAGLIFGLYQVASMLISLPLAQWGLIGLSVLATLVRVVLALAITLIWTVPLGVWIGTSPQRSALLQSVVQIAASVPATALFPAFVLVFLSLPHGLDFAAELLMLLGTQWYLLFNVISGASAIPQDLKYTTTMLGLDRWARWRTLILPALFPFLVTGAITASGGAWNASIVAEYIQFGGHAYHTTGIGALIALATASGDYRLLLASTLSMILAVVLINRLVWRRMYLLAESQYRME